MSCERSKVKGRSTAALGGKRRTLGGQTRGPVYPIAGGAFSARRSRPLCLRPKQNFGVTQCRGRL